MAVLLGEIGRAFTIPPGPSLHRQPLGASHVPFAINLQIVLLVLYWMIMLPVAAYILHAVANYCIGDGPSTLRYAVYLVLVTAVVVFFTYDVSGYIFARMMADPNFGLRMPPNYGYRDWLLEPLGLKWQALGIIPVVRFLPVLFAFIAGGITHVIVWKVEFKLGFLVFIIQAVLTALAMIALAYAFQIGVAAYERYVV